MNNKKLVLALIGLALFLALVYVVVQSQQSKETKAQFETILILIGKGGSPKWSPDGTKIAFVAEDGWLCVAHVEGKTEIINNVAPIKVAGFDWLSNTEFILWEQEPQRIDGVLESPIIRIKKLTLDGKEDLIVEDRPRKGGEVPRITYPIFLHDGTVGYYENYFKQPPGYETGERIFKVIKSGLAKSDTAQKQMRAYVVPSGSTGAGDIWIESMDGEIKKRITSGRLFSFPVLSPDGTKILAVCGSLCGTCVIDLQGNYTCVGKKGYESGDTSSSTLGPPNVKWSPDGKKIAYMYMTGKGEDIEVIGSDIYIENADGTGRIQITDTPDEFEVYPVWSPDGTKIACTGYYSHKIYVIKIK